MSQRLSRVLTLLLVAGCGASASDGVATPPRGPATCRAACVRQCWQNCNPRYSDWPLWSTVCSSVSQCAAACRLSCRYSGETAQAPALLGSPVRVLVNRRLHAHLSVRRYPRLNWALNRTRPKDVGGGLQVSRGDNPPPSSQLESSVVVVDPGGIDAGLALGSLLAANINIDFADIPEVKSGEGWSVTVGSMTRQGSLVFADLSWRPPEDDLWAARRGGGSPLYLVTWELDGGGLTGNMQTDSASVTLSLWPDAVFHVQVELSRRSVALSRSGRLRLDTAGHMGAGPERLGTEDGAQSRAEDVAAGRRWLRLLHPASTTMVGLSALGLLLLLALWLALPEHEEVPEGKRSPWPINARARHKCFPLPSTGAKVPAPTWSTLPVADPPEKLPLSS